MTIENNGTIMNVLTIEELYNFAKRHGLTKAILAINVDIDHINEEIDTRYCEQVNCEDIKVCHAYRPFGWDVEEHTYPAIEIYSHEW